MDPRTTDRNSLTIGFLLGMVIALAVALVVQSGQALPRAYAQTSGSGPGVFAVTGSGTQGQSRDVLFVIDQESRRLGVYEYKDGRLELTAVRNTEYEFRFQEWSPRGKEQRPSVNDMRKASEQQEGGGR